MSVQLALRNIRKSFSSKQGSVDVLGGLSFDITERDFVSIIGPSGCGKTTVFNVIAGLLEPDSGEIVYRGQAVTGLLPWGLSIHARSEWVACRLVPLG